jgi:hypothetical protein
MSDHHGHDRDAGAAAAASWDKQVAGLARRGLIREGTGPTPYGRMLLSAV